MSSPAENRRRLALLRTSEGGKQKHVPPKAGYAKGSAAFVRKDKGAKRG